MEQYKNINSISEVKEVLEKFQEAYTKKDMSQLDEFANEMFATKDGLVVLGSGMNEWCFNLNGTKELIKSHWSSENNYWKEIDFKFQESKIFANENTAWVISIGNIKNTIPENERLENTIEKVKDILGRDEKSQESALDAVRKIVITLSETDKGDNYIWPFRFTSVLIKENDIWKIHQMQFSLDSVYFWQYRATDDNYDRNLFEMPKVSSNEETEEVRKALQVFQDGYTNRDLECVDEYMKEVFVLDKDQVVIGTDAGELCIGPDSIRGIVESDWKYWGDFKMNVDGALISVCGDVAYFTTKAMLKRVTPKEKMLQWISGSADYIFKLEKTPKHKLMEVLCDIVVFLYESERGEIYNAPMRFSGVLVKIAGKWQIHHAQYSDYIDGIPGARTV